LNAVFSPSFPKSTSGTPCSSALSFLEISSSTLLFSISFSSPPEPGLFATLSLAPFAETFVISTSSDFYAEKIREIIFKNNII